MTVFIVSGVAVLLVILLIIGILSRYRKCKSDEILVVYGKTSGDTPAKCLVGGATFVWPIIQGYGTLSMKPFQVECRLDGVLSKQNIEVNVPSIITVAISDKLEVIQNAATRLISMNDAQIHDQVKNIVYGQMRQVISNMDIEELISDRDSLQNQTSEKVGLELEKLGLRIMNINVSDITDNAQYIENLGKKAAQKAASEAERDIAEQTKVGAVGVAEQKKQQAIQTSEIEKERSIQVATNEKDQAEQTAIIAQERATAVAEAEKVKEVNLRTIQKDQNASVAAQVKEEAIAIADQEREKQTTVAQINRDQQVAIATAKSEEAQKVAEQAKLRDVEVAKQAAETETQRATYNAERDAKIAEQESNSLIKQEKARKDAEASAVEFEQNAQARKESATAQSEAKIREAQQEKASVIAEAEGKTRERSAAALQSATVAENNAKVGIAKSDANLGTERAKADEAIGTAQASASEKVGVAKAKAAENVAKAEAAAELAKQKAAIMVAAEIEKERKKVEAEGQQSQVEINAQAEANAIIAKAKAEAEALKLKLLAEAEGNQALAIAKQAEVAAETAHIKALTEVGTDPNVTMAWVLRNQLEGIVGADAAKFEHLNLGQVTVVGGSNQAADLMSSFLKVAEQARTMNVPGLTGLFNKLQNFDQKTATALPTENKEEKKEEVKE